MKPEIPNWLIIAASCGMMLIAVLYPFIRYAVLDWYTDIRKLKPLNREIARTYGYYIQGLNFAFGLLSILFTNELKNESGLAVALSGLIAVYWTGRVITQFSYYPMHALPDKPGYKTGIILMNALIIFFAAVFVWLFVGNMMGYFTNNY